MALSLAAEAFQKAVADAKAGQALAPPLADGDEVVGRTVFRSYAQMLAEGVPDPVVLVDALLYAEGVHLLSGHPGCGKSTLAGYMASVVMAGGRHCIWLDYEAGDRAAFRRMLALGVPIDTLDSHFHYAAWPTNAEDELAAYLARWPRALVVVDSMSKALSAAGLSENDNADVTSWTVKVVKACKDAGIPVLIIDHVAKAGTGQYSRGAGAKLADSDVHWRVTCDVPFSRDQIGEVTVTLHKDREGFFHSASTWSIGDGRGGLVVVRKDRSEKASAAATELGGQILAYFEAHPGVAVTQRALRDDESITGSAKAIGDAIKALASDPNSRVRRVDPLKKNSPYIYEPPTGLAIREVVHGGVAF